MKRGELAKLTNCNIETVRYYEQIGLLPNPPRMANSHRVYSDQHKLRLTFIMRCRDLGFTIADIKGLFALVDQHSYTCGEVKKLTHEHLENVQRKIADLKVLEASLNTMMAKCAGGEIPECPIVDELLAS